MRHMCVGITALAVSVGVLSVAAQGRNFSGTWVIDSEKTMAAASTAGSGSGGGAVMARGGGGGRGGVSTGGLVATGTGGSATATGGGGGRGGAMISTDTIISMDGGAFSVEAAGVTTSYPLNGTEVAVDIRGMSGKARAAWQGDTLVITTTLDSPNGPVTSSAQWSMEGDSLVRGTTRKTYYKRK